jgi:hypothetical protein
MLLFPQLIFASFEGAGLRVHLSCKGQTVKCLVGVEGRRLILQGQSAPVICADTTS